MPEMFGPEHPCPHCAAKVSRYIGPPFPGVRRVVNADGGGYHWCPGLKMPESREAECFCGAIVRVHEDGSKTTADGSAPHDCPYAPGKPRPKPAVVQPETAAQLERGFTPYPKMKKKPSPPEPDTTPTAPDALKDMLRAYRK